MLEQLALLSDNFYKFLTTLCLAVFIYCISFPTLFLQPYTETYYKYKKEILYNDARQYYLEQVKYDLFSQIKDTNAIKSRFYFIHLEDSPNSLDSVEMKNKYYFVSGLDSSTKAAVDSLNKIYFQILILKNETYIDYKHIKLEYDNLSTREYICWVLGILSFIGFIGGMLKWKIDNNKSRRY
jgi:hypothetical protein